MSATHLGQKGIGSGPSWCYIKLEGEQDVPGALLTEAGHAPGNSRLAHMACNKFRTLTCNKFRI